MLKNILKLAGAKKLTETEQRKINGGTHGGKCWDIVAGLSQAQCFADGGVYSTATGKCSIPLC